MARTLEFRLAETGRPSNDGLFSLQDFSLVTGINRRRFNSRRSLLEGFYRRQASVDNSGQVESINEFHQMPYGILSSERARRTFDLVTELYSLHYLLILRHLRFPEEFDKSRTKKVMNPGSLALKKTMHTASRFQLRGRGLLRLIERVLFPMLVS